MFPRQTKSTEMGFGSAGLAVVGFVAAISELADYGMSDFLRYGALRGSLVYSKSGSYVRLGCGV